MASRRYKKLKQTNKQLLKTYTNEATHLSSTLQTYQHILPYTPTLASQPIFTFHLPTTIQAIQTIHQTFLQQSSHSQQQSEIMPTQLSPHMLHVSQQMQIILLLFSIFFSSTFFQFVCSSLFTFSQSSSIDYVIHIVMYILWFVILCYCLFVCFLFRFYISSVIIFHMNILNGIYYFIHLSKLYNNNNYIYMIYKQQSMRLNNKLLL